MSEKWDGRDRGLIFCWERGRQIRIGEPELAARAEKGELVILAWRGGVEEKVKLETKSGTLQYLATWQGLRGDDLNVALDGERVIVCSRTGQAVMFSAKLPDTED
ncbi:MAG: hypothetical protein WD648_10465 [Planctomycetaceae bacterium]